MAREELKWQNIDADDLPAEVKKSFDAMVEAEAAFKAAAPPSEVSRRRLIPSAIALGYARGRGSPAVPTPMLWLALCSRQRTAVRSCGTSPYSARAAIGRRRSPMPEFACSVLDSITGARDVATHNDMLRCNMGCFGCVIPMRFLPVFERFEANSKVCLHRPERGRLALA